MGIAGTWVALVAIHPNATLLSRVCVITGNGGFFPSTCGRRTVHVDWRNVLGNFFIDRVPARKARNQETV
jgi:hypothetical protein